MRKIITSLGGKNSDIPIFLKRFRYGADYAISSNTDDTLFIGTNGSNMEFTSIKYGIRQTVFEGRDAPTQVETFTQNVFEDSIYSRVGKYDNAGVVNNIPDYTVDTWTASGVAAFPNAVLGALKPKLYPNIGTQMMYISNGRLGVKLDRNFTEWDKGIGYEGAFIVGVDPQNADNNIIESTGTDGDGFQAVFDKMISNSQQGHETVSYGSGQQGTWQLYDKYFIGGRNSDAGGNVSGDYFDEWDITKRSGLSYKSSVRIADSVMSGTDAIRIAWIRNKIETQTIINNGWFRNFTHWHTASMVLMDAFFLDLKDIIDNSGSLCWLAGMSEATEYRWFRNIITELSTNQSGVNINVNVTIDNVWNLPLSHLITPISIEVDLTGTTLSGKDIVSNVGRIRSLGSNKYIVDVFADSLQTVLSEGTPDYINLSYPVVSGENFVNGTLTIDTNVLTVATLFSDQNGTVVERKLSNATQHIFNGLTAATTYYLGIMSRENKSIMQTITT